MVFSRWPLSCLLRGSNLAEGKEEKEEEEEEEEDEDEETSAPEEEETAGDDEEEACKFLRVMQNSKPATIIGVDDLDGGEAATLAAVRSALAKRAPADGLSFLQGTFEVLADAEKKTAWKDVASGTCEVSPLSICLFLPACSNLLSPSWCHPVLTAPLPPALSDRLRRVPGTLEMDRGCACSKRSTSSQPLFTACG